jgi:hypothetical protein
MCLNVAAWPIPASAFPGGQAPCDECGPGAHWIHMPGCAAGISKIPFGGVSVIGFAGPCNPFSHFVLPASYAMVQHSAPLDDSAFFPGTRPVDGHLDVIDVEILSLVFTESGATVRIGAGGSPALQPTRGVIVESPGDPALADAYFDVFLEDIRFGVTSYNQVPARVVAMASITCWPPRELFMDPDGSNGCIPLYSLPTPGQGKQLRNLVRLELDPFPPEACCLPDGSCQLLEPELCVASGGVPQGINVTCRLLTCPETEACCLSDGMCTEIVPASCIASGGVPQGRATTCAGVTCPQTEACCLLNGGCANLIPEQCIGQRGMPQGAGTNCLQCDPCESCRGDLNHDGETNVTDLLELLSDWGRCEP